MALAEKGSATSGKSAALAKKASNPALARLAEGLRAKFDPRGILNPGIMA